MRHDHSLPLLAVTALALASACDGCQDPPLDSPGGYFEPIEIGSYEVERVPRIDAPEAVDFGVLEQGDRRTVQLKVSNNGRAPLEVSSWRMSNAAFSLSFPMYMDDGFPTRLEVGESVLLEVSYRADRVQGLRGELVIESNDPKRGTLTIDLTANLSSPCLAVEPPELDFGVVPQESEEILALTLENCSALSSTEVELVPYDDRGSRPDFDVLDPGPLFEGITLEPGERREVLVRFAPDAPGTYRDTFTFLTNVEDEPRRLVEVSGEGAPFSCPRAVIEASRDGIDAVRADPRAEYSGLPLDVVNLDASSSYSADGSEITRVEWALVGRPQDSGATLGGDADDPENRLFLDLSGDYVVELHVWNARDVRSCQPAVLDLRAVPDEDIHIQLVWDTPNDPNQFDSLGSDVDLHLLRSGGIWNKSPWDCFWQNLEPDWGRREDRSDDPSLDIDDVDGWGPENINLNNPETNMRYHVGVHYFSNQGYGASFATVRIYLGGVLVEELLRKRLTDQYFWHAVDIEWPSREITIHDEIDLTFPEGTFPSE